MKKSHRITIQAAGFAVKAICHSILAATPTLAADQRDKHMQIMGNHLRLMNDFVDSVMEIGEVEENERAS